MIDGIDLYEELNAKLKLLDEAVADFRESGLVLAECERKYRVKHAEKILALRAEDFPVTICQDVSKGCPEVASLRFDRDVQRVLYEAAKQSIFSVSLSLRIIESRIKQEYGGR